MPQILQLSPEFAPARTAGSPRPDSPAPVSPAGVLPDPLSEVDRTLFQSFFMGGFESASHGRRDRRRVDVAQSTRHDTRAADDFHLLAQCGIHTVRDALRWHLIERAPASYNWSSFLPMLRAAFRARTQVIWDLCHWGVPDHINPFSPEFPTQFARFAAAAARLIREERERSGVDGPSVFCPINEISFWSWVGGDQQHFFPYAQGRGAELKQQLVRASLAAIRAIRVEDPTARFIQAEPVIQIAGNPKLPDHILAAARHTEGQYEAWDMLSGHREPDSIIATEDVGGSADCLDIVGINFYWNNQWIDGDERTPLGHALHRPLHLILQTLWARYRRPLLITETGAEAGAAIGWLGYIAAEVRQALRLGVPILGLCLYPVMDYPGWDDGRHCSCGLLQVSDDWSTRSIRGDLLAELTVQQTVTPSLRPLGPAAKG